jgi:hypothetical protein
MSQGPIVLVGEPLLDPELLPELLLDVDVPLELVLPLELEDPLELEVPPPLSTMVPIVPCGVTVSAEPETQYAS